MKKKIRLLLKKINALAIVIALLAAAVPMGAAAAEYDFPGYGEAENYGRGVFSAVTHGGAICYDADGNPLMCYSTQGGYFFVIDLLTGEVKEKFKAIGSYTMAHLVETAPNGKVYMHFYPGNTLNVYDPIANTFTAEDPGMSIHSQDGGHIMDDGMMYIGEYSTNGASVYAYDTDNKTIKQYGPLDTNCHYVKGVVAAGNYIYAGTGVGAANTKVIKINKETGEQTNLFTNSNTSIIHNLQITLGKLVINTNGALHILDTSTSKIVKGNIPATRPSEPSPYNLKLIYCVQGNTIQELNVSTKELTKVADSPFTDVGQGKDVYFTQWAQLKTGEWVLGIRTEFMSQIGYFNPNTGEAKAVTVSEIADAGPNIQSMEISPENVIYLGGYQTAMSAYDINKEEFIYGIHNWDQNEGAGFLNGKTYFGVYPGAQIWRYDPEKDWNYTEYTSGGYQGADANPAMVWDIEDEQDRPFVVKGYGDKLYVGTMPSYNYLGGALVIYEEDEEGTPSAETHRNVIPNQSITGIAVKDNLVYLSGTIRGGLGIDPTETQAKIAVFDTDKKEVVTEAFVPDLPVVRKTSTTIGELSFGPDGLLWGVSNKSGLVFAMDPETFEVKKYVATEPGDDRGALARPLYIRWGEGGILYTTAGWNIYAINIETMEYKSLLDSACSLMTLDADGNVWYAMGGNFGRIEVNQYGRFENIAESIEALNEYDYSYEEYNELMTEYESLKNSISENSQTDEIIEAVNILAELKKKLVNIREYFTDLDLSIDYAKQQLNLEGKLMKGSSIAIKIVDPDGNTVLFDQLAKNQDNSFSGGYRIDTIKEGEYFVYLQSEKMRESCKIAINSVLPEDTLAADSFLKDITEILAGAEVSNYFSEPKQVSIIMGIYEDLNGVKSLSGTKKIDVEIGSGEHIYYDSKTTRTSDLIGKELRLFVWEKENLTPLIPLKSIVVNSNTD